MLRGNSNGAKVTDCKGERQVDKSECNVKLLQYTMQFNEANPRAASCLGIAARVGDEEAVKSLLKRRRRIDIGDNRGWTPLHEAAAASSIGCLSLLLKKGTIGIAMPCT
jgi:ankyrin repeat protein